MDVREEGDAFVLELIVPGLTPEDLDIEIVEDVVDIQGEFEKEDRDEGVEYLRQERPTGTFRRRVKLPALLDVNAAEAHLEQGLLTLRVPKAEEALPRTVKVKAK
jgi:HSP20 family protein